MDCFADIFARHELGYSTRSLTSEVIGRVLPRASVGAGDVLSTRSPETNHRTAAMSPPTTAAKETAVTHTAPFSYLVEASLSQRVDGSLATRSVKPSGVDQVSCPQPVKHKHKRIRIKTARRREQCRANQARYRKKQLENAKELVTCVEQLRQEIPLLEKQHSQLVSNMKLNAWHVVVEHFYHFCHGILLSLHAPSSPQKWLQHSESQQQINFLRASMSDDVSLGELRGVNALVEQWRRYTTYFDDLYFQLKHITEASGDLTMATAVLNVTISEETFEYVFPHLDSEGNKGGALKSTLLGQRLSLPCRLCFEWDEQSKRVVRLDTTMDFLPALQQALGSLEDAAFVLERALVSPDCTIGTYSS